MKENIKCMEKSNLQKKQIIKDLKLLEEAGVFLIVLECIIEKLAKKIISQSNTPNYWNRCIEKLSWPNISSGGFIGIDRFFESKFLKKYINIKKNY